MEKVIERTAVKKVVALGKFDGVHIGHRALIKTAVSIARSGNADCCVYEIIPEKPYKAITTEKRKEELIKSLGADLVIRQYLTDEFMSLSPENFVKNILLKRLNAAHTVVGYNFRFGFNRAGDTDALAALCKKYGIGITVIESIKAPSDDGAETAVSSTRIRRLIECGKTEEVYSCLGRSFCMWGIVSEGKHLGRTIGFPTINFYPRDDELIPAHGVYAVKAVINGKSYVGVTNIGINPTVESGRNIKAETYVFDLKRNVENGDDIKIELLEFVRPEIKFKCIDELKERISHDKDYVANKYIR